MSNHRLKENPFYKLQATPRDSDRRLVSRATDIKLLTGEDMGRRKELCFPCFLQCKRAAAGSQESIRISYDFYQNHLFDKRKGL